MDKHGKPDLARFKEVWVDGRANAPSDDDDAKHAPGPGPGGDAARRQTRRAEPAAPFPIEVRDRFRESMFPNPGMACARQTELMRALDGDELVRDAEARAWESEALRAVHRLVLVLPVPLPRTSHRRKPAIAPLIPAGDHALQRRAAHHDRRPFAARPASPAALHVPARSRGPPRLPPPQRTHVARREEGRTHASLHSEEGLVGGALWQRAGGRRRAPRASRRPPAWSSHGCIYDS